MRTKPCLTSADAHKMMAACKAEAQKNGWKVTIAIVDDAAAPLLLERLDGAGPTTPEVALGKARTAALTRQPTRVWEAGVKERPAFLNFPAGLAITGAVPIMAQNECVGAIGVSGAGQVHALVKDRHRSREFMEFLKLLDAAYHAHTAIKLILDNHSAHISKETKTWLADQPLGRFQFTFTPKHGSWLNLVEGFFSKLTRSVLRHIRIASKQELKDRIMAAMDEFNRHPVVHTWSYKLDRAA